MKRLLFAGACVLLMAGSAAAKPGVAITTVNLRAEASTTSAVVAKIPGSGRLEVGECANGWCAATYRGQNGFVIATAVDTTGRRVVRQGVRRPIPGAPGYDPDDDDFVPAPGYGPGPGVVVVPGPFYRPYGYGYGYGYGWGGPRWGYGGWRRW